MSEKLKIEFPSHGWKQFLMASKEMLDAFDRAREKSRSHEVETSHGNVAEAEFSKCLSSFLPKRYGITSGYIVSQGLKSTEKTPHFDVIVYDQLESPVLCVEDNLDVSSQGHPRAIPVEYVQGVLEIKSSFSPLTVRKAIDHLKDLLPLMGGTDAPHERYKVYLPSTFFCGLVFFELEGKFQYSKEAMRKLIIASLELRHFFGGMILRGQGHDKPLIGVIELDRLETPIESLIGRKKHSLLRLGMSQSIQISDNLHFISTLFWSESGFSQFGFDLIAMMQGKYEVGRLSSFYGVGMSDMDGGQFLIK